MRPSWRASSRPLLVGLLFSATLLAGCTGSGDDYDDSPAANVPPLEHARITGITHLFDDEPAPGFSAKTIDGETWRLEDHRGQVVLVEFMGVGCHSCLRNLPDHKRLYEEFEGDPAFAFIAIDVWGRETEEDLRGYRDEHGIGWPMAMAPDGIEQRYGVRGTPTQYLIDHEGRAHARGNVLSYEAMAQEVEYLLGQLRA